MLLAGVELKDGATESACVSLGDEGAVETGEDAEGEMMVLKLLEDRDFAGRPAYD